MESFQEEKSILEMVSDRLEHWHPGPDGLVLNLLNPSPLLLCSGENGKLPHGTITFKDCYASLGEVWSISMELSTVSSFTGVHSIISNKLRAL